MKSHDRHTVDPDALPETPVFKRTRLGNFLRILAAIVLIVIGLLGLILPIIPGIPLLLLGLALLAPNHPRIIQMRRWLAARRKRTPP
jgi:hypothetical protein